MQHSLSFSTLLLSTDSLFLLVFGGWKLLDLFVGFFQEKLFKVAGLPMVENCMAGYNSCMFAYGQVGTNKKEILISPFVSSSN